MNFVRIMKINRAFQLKTLCSYWVLHRNNQPSVWLSEYIMLNEVNDDRGTWSWQNCLRISRELSYVNLIPYDPVSESMTSIAEALKNVSLAFYDTTQEKGVNCVGSSGT